MVGSEETVNTIEQCLEIHDVRVLLVRAMQTIEMEEGGREGWKEGGERETHTHTHTLSEMYTN